MLALISRLSVAPAGHQHLEALRRLVALWQALTFSSCGTEHLFSQSERLFPQRRSRLTVSKRRSELCLIFGTTPMADLAKRAAGVWARVYHGARQRILVRSDKGRKRGPRANHRSWAAISRGRQEAVRSVVKQHRKDAAPEKSFQAQSSNIKAEVDLQNLRLAQRTLKAKQEGMLPQDDLKDAGVKDSLRLARRTLVKQGNARLAPKSQVLKPPEQEKTFQIVSGPLRGHAADRARSAIKTVYVDPAASVDPGRLLGLHVSSILDADLVVTRVAAHNMQMVHCKIGSMLVGAKYMDQDAFQSEATKDPFFLRFAAAVNVRKLWFHFSSDFHASSIYKLVYDASRKPFSKWTILRDKGCYERWCREKPSQCFEVLSTQLHSRALAQAHTPEGA